MTLASISTLGKLPTIVWGLKNLEQMVLLGQEEVRRLSQLPTALEPKREDELWCERSQLARPWPSFLSSITQASHLLIQEPDVSGLTPVVMWHMWVAIYLVGKGYISAPLFLKLLISMECYCLFGQIQRAVSKTYSKHHETELVAISKIAYVWASFYSDTVSTKIHRRKKA